MIDARGALRIASETGSTGRVDIGILNQPWRATWTSNSLTQIATGGNGTLNVYTGNTLIDAGAQIGVGGVGTANIRGSWTNNGDLIVGLLGDGDLNVFSGTVTTNGNASIGTAIFGTPSGRADLTGGDWGIGGSLSIGTGNNGAGVLNINAGASSVTVGGAMNVRSRGDVDLVNGRLTVNGALTLNAGSTFQLSGGHLKTSPATFTAAASTFNWTSGTLEFTGPYTVQAGHVLGDGSLTVGANKDFIVSGALGVGTRAQGSLTVHGGGMVSSTAANVGGTASPGAPASALITGAGSTWDVSGTLTVADDVASGLTLSLGAVLNTASAFASNAAGSNSNIDLAGANTLWANTGSAHLGGSAMAAGAPGTLDITSGAKMTVGNLLRVWEPFTVTLDVGTIETAHLDILGALDVQGTSTVKATGNINISNGADVTFSPTSTFNAAGATLNISGTATLVGAVTGNAMTSATLSAAGTTWTMPGSLEVGTASSGLGRIGSLALQMGSATNVAGDVTVLDVTKFTLAGGTLNATSFDAGDQDFSGFGAINASFTVGGDVTATGNLTIGDINSFNGVDIGGNLSVTSHTVTINKKGFFNVGTFTGISGGTLAAPGGVSLPAGNSLAAFGAVNARIAAQAGSLIEATGNLTLGDATAVDGYFSDGVLLVNEHTVTLGDSNQALLGSLTQLGRGGMAGTLVASNGAAVELGKNVIGFGTVNTPNNPLKPLVNNGHIGGNSAAEKITLNGYVKGVGTFDNVTFAGTFSPGFSPATINMGGNVEFGPSAKLEIEIGGLTPGTQHDRINIAGQATLNGTLELSLINGFVPSPGNGFTIMTFGSRNGTFANVVNNSPVPGIQLQPVYSATDLVLVTLPSGEKVWAVDANGNASMGSNWTGGVAPGGVGDAAAFRNIITADRTVTLDMPLTLGAVRFDDDNSYTLSGNSLTLQAAGTTPAVIEVSNVNGNGAHTIAAPVVLASNGEIIQQSTGALTIAGSLDNSAGRTITKAGAGTLVLSGAQNHGPGAIFTVTAGTANFNTDAGSNTARNLTVNTNSTTNFGSSQHLAALNVAMGATATVTAGGAKNVITGALSIAGGTTPTGTMDITNNAVVVDYPPAGPNPAAEVRQQILSGRGGSGFGATWTGKGITSSTAAATVAAAPESVSVAYAVNGDLPLGPYTTFRGETVDASSVLIRYTRTADANLDGVVNDDDVTIVSATYAPGVSKPHWALGDFDYNGFVDDDDVTLLGVFYKPASTPFPPPDGPTAIVPIPEPSTLMLLTIATSLAAIWARRITKNYRWLLTAAVAALLFLMTPATMAQESTSADRTWVFVGTYTSGNSEGIYRAQLDLESGALSEPELAAKVENPSFLALHPGGSFLYAAGELSNFEGKPGGAVSAFGLDRNTGTLTLLNQQSSRGGGPCHLVVDRAGKNVLVANYGGGSVAVLPIGEDGRLQPASSFVQHTGNSINPRRQEAPHAHSINVDKNGRFAVAADLGLDKLLVYRFDGQHGRLTPNDPPHATVAPGAGPRHFAFHPTSGFAYVINEIHSTVTAFNFDAKKGTLHEIQTVSTLPGPHKGNSTAEVQVHPSGKFLYGSNRGHDSLAIFAIDQETGRLTPVGHQLTGGRTPRNFGIDPTGLFVLAANQSSNNVVVFRVDQQSGRLTPTAHTIEVPMPVCVKMLVIPQ